MAYPAKVLIVDDEASLVQLCQFLLESEGYDVRGTTSSRQALHMINEEMPDIVVLDVMMPIMNGIELCRQIRSQYQNRSPVILMCTADASLETERRGRAAGATDFMLKDSLVHDLPRKIGAYVS
ncbi:MAG: response regulator [Chloroflexota bacterium]|nr:response regulator [Ardenticatenaceae bacterium]